MRNKTASQPIVKQAVGCSYRPHVGTRHYLESMRWFARPESEALELRHTPRPASWNAKTHPDQVRLKAYLDDTEDLLMDSKIDSPWALRLDVGAPVSRDLLTAVADLDNYAYPLATRLKDHQLMSVWCTKKHDAPERSFVRIESAHEVPPPGPGVLAARTTASPTSAEYKEQIYAHVAGATELPAGPVKLELSFIVGPKRINNWPDLWKPTIDALDPLLGRTRPDRPWHPLDGRIVELGMHVTVNTTYGNDVLIGITASPAIIPADDQTTTIRAEGRAAGKTPPLSRPTNPAGMRSLVFGLRVTCPRCGASPGVYCTTRDGNNHLERWNAFNDSRVLAGELGFGDPTTDSQPDEVLAAAHGHWPPPSAALAIRADIERILVNNSSKRFAKVLIGMRRGRSNATMAKESTEEGKRISAESISEVRRLMTLTLDDQLVYAKSDAAAQARIYREVLRHPPLSPELEQHLNNRLADLRKLDPTIPPT